MATPQVSWNLHLLGRRLRPDRKCYAVLFGDSTCSYQSGGASQPRWNYGIRTRWPITWWAQYVTWDGATANSEGCGSIGMNGTGKDPGATLTDGVTTNPFCIGYWDQNVNGTGTHTANLGRNYLYLSGWYGGDWTLGQTMRVRRMNTMQNSHRTNGCAYLLQEKVGGGNDGPGYVLHDTPVWQGSVGARSYTDFTLTRSANPLIQIRHDIHNHAADGNLGTGFYKTMWQVENATTGLGLTRGFGWNSISQGGWNSRNHIDDYSADALTWEIQTCGLNTFIIQLGINVATGESSSNLPTQTYIDNYNELLTKLWTCIDAAGVSDPLVVCLTPWQAGASVYQTAQSDVVLNILKTTWDHNTHCFCSLDSLIRLEKGEGWYAAGPAGAPYLADGTHCLTAGTQLFADLLWRQIQRDTIKDDSGHIDRLRGGRAGRGRHVPVRGYLP